jgi:polysaccharide export outer membrane protein
VTLLSAAGCQAAASQSGVRSSAATPRRNIELGFEPIAQAQFEPEPHEATSVVEVPCCPTDCGSIPRELEKVQLPSYVIEPPDILLIEIERNVRLPSDPIEPLDELLVRVKGTFPRDVNNPDDSTDFQTIDGPYRVDNHGRLDLGPLYGSVVVSGLSLEEARSAIEQHLKTILNSPQVSVSLPELSGRQAVTGEHLVQPDGTVALGIYGDVPVAGLTRMQAKEAIEHHLSQYILAPRIDVSVYAYNSKVYYVITDGGGYGEQVFRFPVTGNETVLDAISQINGLPPVASKKHIWIARPGPNTDGRQILAVDWRAIARDGSPATNYQILPGDRIYVQADRLIKMDSFIAKATSPFERLFGFTLLGHRTVRDLQFGHRGIGGAAP